MDIKEPEDLQYLREVSAQMGADSSLIQASGGNTSIKEYGVLWVKASGKSLANALTDDIFLPLDLAEIWDEIESPSSFSRPFKSLSGSSLRPSIETTLHTLMPHRAVLHCHSVDVIAHTLPMGSQDRMAEKLRGLSWQWIPYCRPGKPLTRAIASVVGDTRTVKGDARVDVLILENHGLVVGGDTLQSAEALQAEVIQRLHLEPRSYSPPDLSQLQAVVDTIPGAFLPKAPVIQAIATDERTLELAQCNPAYPDHVVFCGVRPVVATETNNIPDYVATVSEKWQQDITYVIIPKVGVILLNGASPATEAMLQAQADVLLRVPCGTDVHLLSDQQCLELTDWDAEKYRKALEMAA
ncbi:MAG: class II aldolase/adducin family protein [Cyanobacteria bacterium P01_F01_bin.150]